MIDLERCTGFCQNCEQEVEGAVVFQGRQHNTKMFIVMGTDRQAHKILEGVTQTVLSAVEIDRRLKRKREKEEEERFYGPTAITAATEYPEAQDQESPNEHEAAAETPEDFQ